MDLQDAKRIGHHLQDQLLENAATSNEHWTLTHTVSHLPSPINRNAIYFAESNPSVHWIADGAGSPLLFSVTGSLNGKDKGGEPFVKGLVESWPLISDQWLVRLDSSYGRQERGAIAFANRWEFRHQDGPKLVVNSEREWDGGDDWLSDDPENFALMLAEKLGWA